MIGKHMAAAIQRTGDIIGETGQKIALTKWQEEQDALKRQEERAELDARLEAQLERERIREEGRQVRHEDNLIAEETAESGRQARHEESLAAAKERTLLSIKGRKDLAAGRTESLTLKDELSSLQRQIDTDTDYLGSQGALVLDDAQKAEIQQRIEANRTKLESLRKQGRGPSKAEGLVGAALGDTRYDAGLVGGGQGALRGQQTGGDKPAAGGDNGGVKRISSQEEYDALPSGAIYIDPDDGKPYRKP